MPEVFTRKAEQFWGEVADRRLENSAFLGRLETLLMERETTDLRVLSAEQQYNLLTRRAYGEFPNATEEHPSDLFRRLEQSKQDGIPLDVKYGIDPTGRDIHWGHTLALRSALKMVRMGHNLHFIVGGFTAMVGDGTDKTSPRQPISAQEVEANQTSYFEQVRPLIPAGPGKIEYYNNAEWLLHHPVINRLDEMRLRQHIKATELLKRRTFQDRMEKNKPISMAELDYPILTGLDSVVIAEGRGADVEVCGQDQLMNTRVAQDVQEFFGIEPEAILATHLIPGTDGRGNKMSKSLNNYIGINEAPEVMFSKIMAMADDYTPLPGNGHKDPKPIRFGLIRMYLEQFTEIDDVEWVEIEKRMGRSKNPMDPLDVKQLIARFLVGSIYGRDQALAAQDQFIQEYQLVQHRRELFTQKLEEVGIAGELRGIDFGTLLSLGQGQRKLMEQSRVRIIRADGQSVGVVLGRDKIMVNNPDTSTDKRKQIPLTESEFKQWLIDSGVEMNDLLLQNGEAFFTIHIDENLEI